MHVSFETKICQNMLKNRFFFKMLKITKNALQMVENASKNTFEVKRVLKNDIESHFSVFFRFSEKSIFSESVRFFT